MSATARSVPGVVRAARILELFLVEARELTPREVTDRVKLPRTTVHELLHTLVEVGYLSPGTANRNAFQLGVQLFRLGSAWAERVDLTREGRTIAEAVSRRCDETVHIAILEGLDVIYIAKVDSTHSVRLVSGVGRRLPAHCTAVGKILLAGLQEAALEARLPETGVLQTLTPASIASVPELLRALADIRLQGIAFERMESNQDVACVAAPIYDASGEMVAAMSIAVPVARWGKRTSDEWSELVREGAGALSRQLGFRVATNPLVATETTFSELVA